MDKLKRVFSTLNSALFIGVTISLVFSLFAFYYYQKVENASLPPKSAIILQIQKMSDQTIDFRLLMRGPRSGSNDIALLTVDEDAVQKLGRWPWPRSLIAKAIEKTMEQKIKVMGFDMIFSEPQSETLTPFKDIQQTLIQKKILSDESWLNNLKKKYDYDSIMRDIVNKHSEQLVMGAYYDPGQISYGKLFNDVCLQIIQDNYPDYKYWENDQILVGVLDKTGIDLPSGWIELLKKHRLKIEKSTLADLVAKKYFIDTILFIQKTFPNLDPIQTTALLHYSLKDEVENARALLAKKNYELDIESLKNTFLKILNTVSNHDQVELKNSIEQNTNEYCYLFLTPKDTLLPQIKTEWQSVRGDKDPFKTLSFDESLDYLRAEILFNPIQSVEKWWINIPQIAEVTKYSAFFNTHLDNDGVIRRSDLVVQKGNQYIPSLAFKMYLLANKFIPNVELTTNPYDPFSKSVSQIELRNDEDQPQGIIPGNHKGQVLINYAGKQQMFPHVSVSELFNNKEEIKIKKRVYNSSKDLWEVTASIVNKKEFFKDKYIIFGATAQGIYDLRVTPFEENYPGLETHANILDNLIRNDFLQKSDKEKIFMPLFLFFFGTIFSFLLSNFGALWGLIATFFSLVSIYIIDKNFLFNKGIVINILFPISFILTIYTILTFYKYFTEEKKKRELKGTFSKYVSPAIVDEILKDPSNLELGGKKQHMTVFFSDVRGFTTISEKLDPRALSDLLNSYLTPMTELVFKHQGTLDKYMGDAIMAFFGAPLADPKHANKACSCALEQIEKLKVIQNRLKEEGLPAIDIGIGINTGEMSVGNMGSETVRNYTVMGDSVNLGSRLEGINKEYGTRIIISEFTQSEIDKDRFFTREIDWVKVKGKNKPVRIFELLGENSIKDDTLNMLTHFQQGFELYHSQSWDKSISAFEKGLTHRPDDPVSILYIKRCKEYLETPPPSDWDGVFTMKTK